MPNDGLGEKAKGAILSRAVRYIRHLQENEARNIQKWTLETLLGDQAMGDLLAQLEGMRIRWEEERLARQRLEPELKVLRAIQQGLPVGAAIPASTAARGSKSPDGPQDEGKRDRDNEAPSCSASGEKSAHGQDKSKRKRVD